MHEAKNKADQMKIFKKHFDKIKDLPEDYSVCLDHMKPDKTLIKEMSDDDLHKAIDRAINVKKGEFFIAREIQPSDKRLKSDKAFLQFVEETFDAFLRFYQ